MRYVSAKMGSVSTHGNDQRISLLHFSDRRSMGTSLHLCYFQPKTLPTELAYKLVDKIRPEPDLFVMLSRLLDFAEDILHPDGIPVNINVDIGTRDMEHGHHLVHIVRYLERVDVPRRLECVAALFCPPRVLQVVPSSFQHHGVHRAGVAVSREDARLAYPQEVDEVALAGTEEKGPEPDPVGLRDPETLVAVQVEGPEDDVVVKDVGKRGAAVGHCLRVCLRCCGRHVDLNEVWMTIVYAWL